MGNAKLITVIETTLQTRGNGKETPIRVIRQYWDSEGELLAEVDPSKEYILSQEITKLLDILDKMCYERPYVENIDIKTGYLQAVKECIGEVDSILGGYIK